MHPLPAVFRLIVLLAFPLLAQIPSGIVFTPVFGTAGAGAFGGLAAMEEIPGKPGYFLVAEMSGTMTLLTPGAGGHTRSTFVTIATRPEQDQGLAPFTFHPRFTANRKYYVKIGDPTGGRRFKIDEREASADFLKDSGKQPRTLMTVDLPAEFADHNGGGIGFGADGYLYIGIGDGGWDLQTPDIHNNGQNRETLLSKILRIDVDKKDPGLQYGIPSDNPFVPDANPLVRREIFAYGMRNPFRMSFDRLTGELYVGDVGLFQFEKINIVKKGANYGWKLQEHTFCYPPGPCDNITVDPPAGYMPYGQVKCFVGGQTYRGDPASPFYGVHIFGDYTTKRILAFKKGTGPVLVTDLMGAPAEMTNFTLDSQNNMYMIGHRGTIYKLEHKDLVPHATSIQLAGKSQAGRSRAGQARAGLARLEVFAGLGFEARRQGTASLFRLDGSRLGTLNAQGGFEGKPASLPTGMVISVPSR